MSKVPDVLRRAAARLRAQSCAALRASAALSMTAALLALASGPVRAQTFPEGFSSADVRRPMPGQGKPASGWGTTVSPLDDRKGLIGQDVFESLPGSVTDVQPAKRVTLAIPALDALLAADPARSMAVCIAGCGSPSPKVVYDTGPSTTLLASTSRADPGCIAGCNGAKAVAGLVTASLAAASNPIMPREARSSPRMAQLRLWGDLGTPLPKAVMSGRAHAGKVRPGAIKTTTSRRIPGVHGATVSASNSAAQARPVQTLTVRTSGLN